MEWRKPCLHQRVYHSPQREFPAYYSPGQLDRSVATSDNTYEARQPLTFLIQPVFLYSDGIGVLTLGSHALFRSELRK